MNQWTLAGVLASIGGGIVWLHSVGALPAGFLYWSVVTLLIIVLTYGVSWGLTEARKRLCIPRPWDSPENQRRIYRTAMLTAALPSGSAAIGIGLTHPVPMWGWFIVPWLVLLLAVSSPWAWRLVFEVWWPRINKE